MKKILVLGLIIVFAVWAYLFLQPFDSLRSLRVNELSNVEAKRTILRIGLVADSHNENELLGNALRQAQGKGINFVIGLGDYTNLGTIEELNAAKNEFEKSKLEYFVIPGDRDGWESREKGLDNFDEVFGKSNQIVERNGVQFVLLDNSNIYSGISEDDWEILTSDLSDLSQNNLRFVFAHKTPFHPESAHVMGEDSPEVAGQAKDLLEILEKKTRPCHSELNSESGPGKILKQVQDDMSGGDDELCPSVDGFFSGDLHFFAKFNSPNGSVKMTTVGAVASDRNFQGPRFAILTVFEDYSWQVDDVAIR